VPYRRLLKLSQANGQLAFLRQRLIRTYDGNRIAVWAPTPYAMPAVLTMASQLPKLPKHDVGAVFGAPNPAERAPKPCINLLNESNSVSFEERNRRARRQYWRPDVASRRRASRSEETSPLSRALQIVRECLAGRVMRIESCRAWLLSNPRTMNQDVLPRHRNCWHSWTISLT
jgi:hypothetical protein